MYFLSPVVAKILPYLGLMAGQTPGKGPTENKVDEVSLEEIDKIIAGEDPEFAQSLTEIQQIGVESEVDIETAVPGEEALASDSDDEKKRGLSDRFPWVGRVKSALYSRWVRFKNQLVIIFNQTWVLARTLPKDVFGYCKAMIAAFFAALTRWKKAFTSLTLVQKLLWFGFVTSIAAVLFLAQMSLKGIWLPIWERPNVTSIANIADRAFPMPEGSEFLSLYRAFPQPEIEYLFPKFVINLKRTNSYQNPMGVFEFFVVLDSQDAALEVKARSHELHDRLQRALEDQTYSEMTSPLGKKRVKDVLRKELNSVLTQGWVKEVLIKTMVLKP